MEINKPTNLHGNISFEFQNKSSLYDILEEIEPDIGLAWIRNGMILNMTFKMPYMQDADILKYKLMENDTINPANNLNRYEIFDFMVVRTKLGYFFNGCLRILDDWEYSNHFYFYQPICNFTFFTSIGLGLDSLHLKCADNHLPFKNNLS
jgi:hypothetical protein